MCLIKVAEPSQAPPHFSSLDQPIYVQHVINLSLVLTCHGWQPIVSG